MNYLAALAILSVASSAKLDKIYLPRNAQTSSGANAGLQAPYNNGQQSVGRSQNLVAAQNQAEILKYDNTMDENGYHYAFETSDGTKAEQDGRVIPGATPEDGSLQVSGSYSYVGDDGQTYSITYTADENGYRASGAHLPTPPPIPESILKSLALTAGSGALYDSKKSSYDADNGY